MRIFDSQSRAIWKTSSAKYLYNSVSIQDALYANRLYNRQEATLPIL